MNRWEAWERNEVLVQRALDLSEQAAKERDEFRWWLTASAVSLSLAVVAAVGDAPVIEPSSRALIAAGLILAAAGTGTRAWELRCAAARTYAEARRAVEVFFREAS